MGCTASAAATPYQAGSASPLSPEEVAVCVVKGSFKMYKNQYRPFATLPLSADHPETERVDRVQVDAYIGQLGDPAGLPLVDRLLVDTPALFLFKFPSSNEALYQHGGLGPVAW